MKTILQSVRILTFLLPFVVLMPAQAQWTSVKAAYGGSVGNDGAVSFVIGSKAYLIAGSSINNVYEYDIAGNSWTDKGVVPSAAGHAFAMAFVLNNKAYLIGGDTGGIPLATVWMYDPSAATPWTQKNNFPGGVRDAGIAFTVNNTGYAGCGFDGATVHDDVWKYNEAGDTWTQVADPVPSGLIFSSSFVIGNTAYVVGGGTPPSGVSETQQMWEFDAANQKWKASVAFPGTARQAAFSFANNSYGYYGGGMSGYTTVYFDVWQFDPLGKKWSKVQDVPMLGPAWASSFASGNNAYVGLGAKFLTTGLTGDDKFFKYSIPTNSIGTIAQGSSFSIYPNPAGDRLYISGPLERGNVITVYNNAGKVVLHSELKDNSIDIKELPAGLYLLRIAGKSETTNLRFVKE